MHLDIVSLLVLAFCMLIVLNGGVQKNNNQCGYTKQGFPKVCVLLEITKASQSSTHKLVLLSPTRSTSKTDTLQVSSIPATRAKPHS